MRAGLLTGGGDCPGLNAVIRAVTKSLLLRGCDEVIGIEDGFLGLIEGRCRPLELADATGLLDRGGTILGTSNRDNPLASDATTESALAHFRAWGLDALVVIGGDGTLSIADGLSAYGVPCVGVPKTIDNDIAHCDRSFGFDTAVATATEAMDRVQTTAQSHHRVMIVETMGRHAGWLALESGLAAAADIILLPEIPYDLAAVAAHCRQRERRESHTLICIGEGARAIDGELTVSQRVASDRTNAVRLGGVGHVLQAALAPLIKSEVRCTVLGHVQRGGRPTAFDRVLASQFGHQAAQLLQQGRFNRTVTLQGGQMADVPLADVAHQQRTVPPGHPLLAMARDIGVFLGVEGEPGEAGHA